MNKHLTDGELRAALDGELESGRLHHLENCETCLMRKTQMQDRMAITGQRLAFLRSANETSPAAPKAWLRFSQHTAQQKEYPMLKSWFTRPLVRLGIPVIVMLILVLAIPGTRALAGQLLNLFRVQQVQVVPLDFTGLEQLTGDGALGNQFTELISSSMDVRQEPGDPVAVNGADEASQLAGFQVRLPSEMAPGQMYLTGGAAFSIKLDREKAQSLLDEAGRTDLVLPPSVDGAEISVNIPTSISAGFGTCPKPGANVSGNTEQSSTVARYPDCMIFVQMPSPVVEAPANLDVEGLARVGLEFTGMSPEEVTELTRTVNWTSTLLVPIPRNASKQQQVSVDGVTGTLIERTTEESPQFVLLWVKDGIIYAISGLGLNSQKALEIANALP